MPKNWNDETKRLNHIITCRRNLALGRAAGVVQMVRLLATEISALTGVEDDPLARESLKFAMNKLSVTIYQMDQAYQHIKEAHQHRKDGVEMRKKLHKQGLC